jgi:hypothetical protein
MKIYLINHVIAEALTTEKYFELLFFLMSWVPPIIVMSAISFTTFFFANVRVRKM